MTKPNREQIQALFTELRNLAPERPLTYGESLQVGRVQASRLRRWANAHQPDINLIWLVKQRLIPVNFVPSHKLGEESGLTTNAVSGKLEMFINEGEPLVRQRFSVLHELKHAIDFDLAPTLHAKLGRGNAQVQASQIEAICNDFAAHVLMPTPLVKREWFTWRELSLVAGVFNVSVEAMATRLEKLGILGERKPMPRMYFRRVLLSGHKQEDFALAT